MISNYFFIYLKTIIITCENSISKCDSFPFKDKKSRFFIFERKSIKLLHYGQKELYPY